MSVKVETPEVETVSLVESPKNAKAHDEEDICELEHLRKLFIGGLASHTTEENLKQFYGKWGTVVDAVVMRDPTTKRSRGFGFITYTKASSVDEAQKNRPHIIDSKTVDPKRALPRPERETRETNISVKKLFVGGLKDNHDEKCLEEYFSKFGNVISVKILTDRTTGKRRGFAFIEYDDYDSVDKAILQKAHTIKYVVVDVKKSVYKQEKQQGNEAGTDDASANNGQKLIPGGQKPANFRPPVPQQPMPPYQQGPPAPYPQGAPYNYWGPPQHPPPPQYGPYPQPPAPANGWNAPYAWNSWNAGPPPPQIGAPPANWYPNQWQSNNAAPGPQPPNGPAPVGGWNAPPVGGPPPPQCPPANFGNGYQQNYAAGPTKNNQSNTNRMHPYGPPQNSNYANGNQQPPPQGYNGYGAVKPPAASAPPKNGPPAGPPVNTAAQMANKFRR